MEHGQGPAAAEAFVLEFHGVTDVSALETAPVGNDRGNVVVCTRRGPRRDRVEAFIRDAFGAHHGATIRSFPPILVGLEDAGGRVLGAAGFRPAEAGPLFLEQYLAEPVESLIARRAGEPVSRHEIAEIGNFACRDCATALTLIDVLARFLVEEQRRWVVFTATRTVRRIMRHLEADLQEIGRADPGLLPAAEEWGTYFAADPRVMFGRVLSWRACAPAAGET
jgi:hypothetical protein